jgi:cytochrome c-type biogenesis protein CcmH
MKKILSVLMFVTLFAAFWTGTVAAQDPKPPMDDDVNRVARQLFCPVCENTPLDVCPTDACKQWRALIREKLADGWTDEQIKQYFVEQYGARVLAEPPRQGWYWAIYIVPVVLFLAGVFILYRAYLSMRTPLPAEADAPETAAPAPVGQADYLRRVEEELKKRN